MSQILINDLFVLCANRSLENGGNSKDAWNDAIVSLFLCPSFFTFFN